MMDTMLFREMLEIDSTSGRERNLADFLAEKMKTDRNRLERFDVATMAEDVPEGCGLPQNLLFSWGVPEVLFCTHLDTVPPYILPTFESLAHEDASGTDDLSKKGMADTKDLPETEASRVLCDNGIVDIKVSGRGTCDAKGQIFAMWEACKALETKGYDGFGLLLLAGEETGSFGAKIFNSLLSCAPSTSSPDSSTSSPTISALSSTLSFMSGLSPVMSSETETSPDLWVIVGEPTDNCMATAAKGTKSFEVTFKGEAFHSGYPEHGASAVEMFGDFLNALRSIRFPYDDILGETTYNIGKLISDNPQNILSPELKCRVYFRTTFESDQMVCNVMKNMAGPDAKLRFGRPKVQDGSDIVSKDVAPWQSSMSVKALGGDSPTKYETFEGFETKPVSFGSDAPQLTAIPHKILCGPGSILVAHRPDEHILMSDIETAIGNYIRMAEQIISKCQHKKAGIRADG